MHFNTSAFYFFTGLLFLLSSVATAQDSQDSTGDVWSLDLTLGLSSTSEKSDSEAEIKQTTPRRAEDDVTKNKDSLSPVFSLVGNYNFSEWGTLSLGFDSGLYLGINVRPDPVELSVSFIQASATDWENPYLFNEKRKETSVDVTLTTIEVSTPYLGVSLTNQKLTYKNDVLGDAASDYKRSSSTNVISVFVPLGFDIEEGKSSLAIVPIYSSIESAAEGDVFSYNGEKAGLTIEYSQESGYSIAVSGEAGTNRFNKQKNAFYDRKRKDESSETALEASFPLFENAVGIVAIAQQSSDSNINLYDEEENSVSATFAYTF